MRRVDENSFTHPLKHPGFDRRFSSSAEREIHAPRQAHHTYPGVLQHAGSPTHSRDLPRTRRHLKSNEGGVEMTSHARLSAAPYILERGEHPSGPYGRTRYLQLPSILFMYPGSSNGDLIDVGPSFMFSYHRLGRVCTYVMETDRQTPLHVQSVRAAAAHQSLR